MLRLKQRFPIQIMKIFPENRGPSSSEESQAQDLEQSSSEETQLDSDSDTADIPVVRSFVVVSSTALLCLSVLISHLSFLVEAQPC